MAEIYRSDIVRVDLDHALLRKHVGAILVTGDKLGNRFGAEIFRDGKPVDVTGCGVTAYFMRPGEDAIVLNGTASGSVAYVDLAQACYSKASSFTLTIKISYGGSTTALRVIDGYILLTQTDDLVDPGDVVPTLDDIFAQIAAMETATEGAQVATAAAIAAKDNANGAAVYAVNIATEKGDQAIQLAQEEADKQNVKIAALTQEIDRNTAPPILPTATGETVTVSDSAHRPLAGLRLYGKTTQDGVPTPNNPVPLVNVGAGGNIETTITAKNRFDFDGWKASCVPTRAAVAFGDKSVTITATEADAFVVSGIKVPVVGGKTYTITFNVSDDNIFKTNHLFKNGAVDDSMHVHHGTKYTFTADADAQFYTVRFGIQEAGNTVTFSNIMVVEGVDVLPYEPGAPMQIINVSTPGGLRGIPVPMGGTYTDETGKQWVCDEVDLGRGVRVQRISRVVGNDTNAVFVQPGMWYLNGVIASGAGGRLGVLASHYKAYSTNEAQHGNVCVNGMGMIVFGNEAYTDEATMRANLAQNPVTVDCILTSPIETPLTADELAAFRAMTSNKPSTVVYNDAGAVLGVDYVADTKNYIDQKLAAIAAATL